jgi:meiotic recombination protein DMC1
MAGSTTKRKMQSIKGLSELKADKIHEAITKASPPSIGGFVTALELKQTRKKVFHISTGCKAFDAMLGG